MVSKWLRPGSLTRLALFMGIMVAGAGGALAQRASATPVPAVLVRATPASESVDLQTPTPAPITAASPAARLQALASAGEVNVRALPDVDSELLGRIVSGTRYPVLRNYYRWYEFRYDLSPSGRAWVFGDLVELDGDLSQIVVIDDFTAIADDNASAAEAVDDRTIDLATAPAANAASGIALDSTPLPTFTPPAATQAASGDQLLIARGNDARAPDVPPIMPILALGGLGIIGLLISLLRG